MSASNKDNAALAEQLAKLTQAYLEQLPSQFETLKKLAASLSGDENDAAILDELHHHLHKLAGSGGTFGFADLSTAARNLENRILSWKGNLKDIGVEHRRALSNDVVLLERNLAVTRPTVSFNPSQSKHKTSNRSSLIWLVEDDELLGRELVRQIESFNYKVRFFTCVDEVEEAARSEKPDIIIMDILFSQNHENSIMEFALRPGLKALQCPVLFISSLDNFSSRVSAAQVGAAGYFIKPLDIPRLINRIEQIIGKLKAPPQRVLIVDDDEVLAEHYRLVLLNAGMEVEVLNEPEKILAKISSFRPELVIMDMHMPTYSGPDLAGVIRQHSKWDSLPIVYLSAETELENQLQALNRGADDFLTKPITDAHLVAAVRVRIDRYRHLNSLISRDSMTGLLKHSSIKEAADIEIIRAKRSGKPATLAILDIDHFKSVNDIYGHAAGDIVISSMAMLLRQRLRQSDIAGRYGGEEFVVVLPDCDIDAAYRIMEDLRQRFAALLFTNGEKTFSCTFSAGLAGLKQHPGLKANELLIVADQALYAAKQEGRNQVRPQTSSGSETDKPSL